MAPRQAITKNMIIEATLDLIRESGWESVSARSLAAKLGTSTMPIYSSVGSMDDLKREAILATFALIDAAQHKRRTDNEALDLAVGYVAFARDEPRLFRFLMAGEKDMDKLVTREANREGFEDSFGATASTKELFRELQKKGRKDDFVLRTWIFSYGLAELVSGGSVDMDEPEIIRHLTAAGGAFYLYDQNTQEGR
jgi:AcrR family transcriptional regulator